VLTVRTAGRLRTDQSQPTTGATPPRSARNDPSAQACEQQPLPVQHAGLRRTQPRFQGENFQANLRTVEKVNELAQEKGCTAGQLALAWAIAQDNDVAPIPGTKRRTYLDENVAAASVQLTAEDLDRLQAISPFGAATGARYAQQHTYGDSPEPSRTHRHVVRPILMYFSPLAAWASKSRNAKLSVLQAPGAEGWLVRC
jgi:hypothetical protein